MNHSGSAPTRVPRVLAGPRDPPAPAPDAIEIEEGQPCVLADFAVVTADLLVECRDDTDASFIVLVQSGGNTMDDPAEELGRSAGRSIPLEPGADPPIGVITVETSNWRPDAHRRGELAALRCLTDHALDVRLGLISRRTGTSVSI